MALQPRAIASDRLAFHESVLSQYEDRGRVLRIARDDARASILRAQRNLEAIEAELHDIQDRTAQLRTAILRLRGVQSLPDEVLALIFTDLVRDNSAACAWDECFIEASIIPHAMIQYRIAAVCRRWRQMALRTPTVWSFLVIPPVATADDAARLLWHAETMIERSRGTPIEVVIPWQSLNWTLTSFGFADVLATVGRASRQWRHVSFILSGSVSTRLAYDIFRGPMPILETLAVLQLPYDGPLSLSDSDSDASPHYLPYCPALRRLIVQGCDVVHTGPSGPLFSLVALTLSTIELAGDVIWQVLSLLPALEYLDLRIEEQPQGLSAGSNGSGQLRCPALAELICRSGAGDLFSSWGTNLDLPVLSTLELEHFSNDISNLLSRVSASVTTFAFSSEEDDLAGEDAVILAALHNVRDLHIGYCETMDDAFFTQLTDNDFWPKLENITISTDWCFSDAVALTFEAFVRSRSRYASQSSTDGTESTPCRLRSVDFSKSLNVQGWLINNVDFLLDPEAA